MVFWILGSLLDFFFPITFCFTLLSKLTSNSRVSRRNSWYPITFQCIFSRNAFTASSFLSGRKAIEVFLNRTLWIRGKYVFKRRYLTDACPLRSTYPFSRRSFRNNKFFLPSIYPFFSTGISWVIRRTILYGIDNALAVPILEPVSFTISLIISFCSSEKNILLGKSRVWSWTVLLFMPRL